MSKDGDIVTIYVTRSAGNDGAVLILIDTADETGPIRVAVNEGNVFADVDYECGEEMRDAGQAVFTVTAAEIAYTGGTRS